MVVASSAPWEEKYIVVELIIIIIYFLFLCPFFFSLISNFVPRVLRVFGWHVITLQPVHILGTRLLFSINKLFLILLM